MRIYLFKAIITSWYILTLIMNWVCLALDNLFYPGYKKTEIKPPVFIIGMPRSSTTLCQNLMYADKQHFTGLKLWEILFAPSVIQKKIVNLILRLDKKLNGVVFRRVSKFDHYLFRKMETHHPISLFNLEEDNFLFLHTLTGAALSILFPRWTKISVLQRFDDQASKRRKKIEMSFYKGCIRRHLYVYGRERRFLSKNPPNSPRIRTLQATFPGCQFVYALRDPLYTIASAIGVFIQFRKMFLLKTDVEKMTFATLLMADLFYNYPLIECSDLRGKKLFIVTFNELTKNAHAAIRQLYMKLEIEFTDEYEKILLNSKSTVDMHKTNNTYNPEEFGLTSGMIRERYGYIYRVTPDLTGQKNLSLATFS